MNAFNTLLHEDSKARVNVLFQISGRFFISGNATLLHHYILNLGFETSLMKNNHGFTTHNKKNMVTIVGNHKLIMVLLQTIV